MPHDSPTLNLGQVDDRVASGDNDNKFFHTFGIFRKEISRSKALYWQIYDENKEIEIKLGGTTTEYPRPKPGDIIRIHRLRINANFKTAEIPLARNVLIWPAFEHEPKPVTVARSPTIEEDDKTRRRILEAYFCTRLSKLVDFTSNGHVNDFYDVAGRYESMSIDQYGHQEIVFTDGTASMVLRVFRKLKVVEDDAHFNLASELRKGQYFVAFNVKLDAYKRLNLSANLNHGRSFRLVEQSSILGTKLKELLGDFDQVTEASSATTTNGVSQSQVRRSPRLLQQTQEENRPQVQSSGVIVQEIEDPISTDAHEGFPKFTRYTDIQRKEFGYDFYDIVGQVRDKPRLTSGYGNCVIQIFDGSFREFVNFYAPEVEHPLEGCLILLVYSKQKESDTNEHFEKAVTLREGDIIHVKNVKVSFVQGKIKPELSANKSHDKSINLIDKQSPFGRKILEMAETPQVAELVDVIDPVMDSSFPDSDVDVTE